VKQKDAGMRTFRCVKTVLVMCGFLLISSCGPTLFTVAGHNVTLGGIMISQSVQKVIKENKEEPRQCAEGWDTLSITIPCEDNE